MTSFLQHRASNTDTRGKHLHLSQDPNVAEVVKPPPVIPVSPTDTILSPCSKKLGTKIRSHSDSNTTGRRPTHQPRAWQKMDIAQEEVCEDDLSGGSSVESDEGPLTQQLNCENGTASEQTEGTQGDKRAFFSAWPELTVSPRPSPSSLPVVLGSSSAHRRVVMERLGWQFTTLVPGIDESAIRHSNPEEMCRQIAAAKASALMTSVQKPALLITADQVCVFEGVVREKPKTAEEARFFLQSYSGSTVSTLSAVCVTNVETGVQAEGLERARVCWREIHPDTVDIVVARGSVMSSAGGFAIEEPELSPLVERIDGTVDSVYGLPVEMLCRLMSEASAHKEIQ